MKHIKGLKIIVASLLTVALFSGAMLFYQPAQANEDGLVGKITAHGKASVIATPDVAWVSLGVIEKASTVDEAQQSVAKKMEDILLALKNAGIKDEHIKTVQFNIYPNYIWIDARNEQKIDGYTVTHQLEVKILDVDQSGKLLDATVKAGGNSVSGIRFGLNDETALYAQALELAVKDAKVKAEAMGKGLGIVSIKPLNITEQAMYNAPYRASDLAVKMESEAYDTQLLTGELSIQAEVIVEFSY